jgi:hypothetical protein
MMWFTLLQYRPNKELLTATQTDNRRSEFSQPSTAVSASTNLRNAQRRWRSVQVRNQTQRAFHVTSGISVASKTGGFFV